jgi:hypothetical protein
MKKTVEVSFETWKRLILLLKSPNDSEGVVIERLLDSVESSPKPRAVWRRDGAELPDGTELRKIVLSDSSYAKKGEVVTAKIEGGKIVVEGKAFDSPSAAAFAIVNHGINGWDFWQVKFPNSGEWIYLSKLRKKNKERKVGSA